MITPIQRATAKYFGIHTARLRLKCSGAYRNQTIVNARHVARYLERQTGKSFPAIGRDYDCDHTSVIASVRHMEERLAANDVRYVTPVATIAAAVKAEEMHFEAQVAVKESEASKTLAEIAAKRVADAMKCPTCGAPIIAELRRQIVELQEKVAALTPTISGGINIGLNL